MVTTRTGPKQTDTRARASLISINGRRKKKVHRQQQHFHATVYITEMWLEKKKIGNKTAKKEAPRFPLHRRGP